MRTRFVSVVVAVIVFLAAVLVYAHAAGGLAIDGSAKCHDPNWSGCTMTLSTTSPNDLIVVISASVSGGGVGTFDLARDTAGLSYSNRAEQLSSFNGVREDFAVASGILTNDLITCQQRGNLNARVSCVAFAISGASAFDGIPCFATGTGTTPSCNKSTVNPSDMMIGGQSSGNVGTIMAGSGYSTIASNVADGSGDAYAEYKIGSSLVVSSTLSSSQQWDFIGDAIQPASSSSTTTTSSTTITTTTSSTTSSCGIQCYVSIGSNRNYVISNGGNKIHNFTVSMILTSPLNGKDTLGGNWSLQVNGYSPLGYKVSFMQWVVQYGSGTVTQVSDYFASDATLLGGAGGSLPTTVFPVKSSSFSSGSKISLSMVTNSTGHVVAFRLLIVDGHGLQLVSNTINFASSSISTITPALRAPVVGFEVVLVGEVGASSTTFSSLGATLVYTAQSPITWTSLTPSSISYIGSRPSTAETANSIYWIPQQEQMQVIGQTVSK